MNVDKFGELLGVGVRIHSLGKLRNYYNLGDADTDVLTCIVVSVFDNFMVVNSKGTTYWINLDNVTSIEVIDDGETF